MSKNKIEKNYVSPLDRFLYHFDQEHPALSASQQKEIAKYSRISRLRDLPSTKDSASSLPEDF